MQVFLKKHGASHAHHTVKVNMSRSGQTLTLSYQVQKRDGTPWLADDKFSDDWSKNWGLWNTDVVESFLQLRQDENDLKAPYLEIQVSPLNQPFALIITEPRKKFYPPPQLDFKTEVEIEGRAWRASMTVTLPPELKGTKLYGSFFACLSSGPREYYALETNPEANPDFHRPELFTNLDEV